MATLRRSMLFLPGNNERFLSKGLETEADGIILDLEDSVTSEQKPVARGMVKRFLQSLDFHGKERAVRVNGVTTRWGEEDIWAVVEGGVDLVLLPKADSDTIVLAADRIMTEAEGALGRAVEKTKLMPMIETAMGVINVERTVFASPRIVALCFGGGDYRYSTRVGSTPDEVEYLYPESKVMLAARAAGKVPIGTAFHLDISDLEALVRSARRERTLGFEGKMVIHPTHVKPVNEVFTPTREEIEHARRVINAYAAAEREGRGAIRVEGRLVEHMHAEEARRVLEIAHLAGVLQKD